MVESPSFQSAEGWGDMVAGKIPYARDIFPHQFRKSLYNICYLNSICLNMSILFHSVILFVVFSVEVNKMEIVSSHQRTENKQIRGKWANKAEYVLSALGYTIGLGNIWRFPYLCYRNGGGAFLVPYLLMLFTCGIPLYFLEANIGQFSSSGCLAVFRMCPLFKGAGYAIIAVCVVVTVYFSMLLSYPLLFLTYCFQDPLPWITCDNPWNTEYCAKVEGRNSTFFWNDTKKMIAKTDIKSPSDEFFHHKILNISPNIDDLGEIVWPLLASNIVCWIIVYLCIVKGVKSVGKVVYLTAVFPFVILFILLIRGLTLPGAMNGVYFYIFPDWKQLKKVKVWADAAMQIFFSLGPGWGGIVNVASYSPFNNNSKLDAIIIPIICCGTSIFAGLVVFSVLGFMAHETGLPISEVATGGPGFAFVTYPEAISMLPLPQLWAVLFFLMLFFVAIDSLFVQLEAVISALFDEVPQLKKHESIVVLVIIILLFFASILFSTRGGMYWLQLFDWYCASITLLLICFCEVVMVGWTYGIKNFVRDVEFMIGEKLSLFWIISWTITAPFIIGFIFVMTIVFNTRATYNSMEYPDWAIALGWCSCFVSLFLIPLYMIYRLLYIEEGNLIDRIKKSIRPAKDWAPADLKNRLAWEKLLVKNNYRCDTQHTDEILDQFIS